MKILNYKTLPKDRIVKCPDGGFTSYRFLLEKDGMGFTLTHTVIPKSKPQFWHYKNHLEACYCVSGVGVIKNINKETSHAVTSGTVYVLDNYDAHTFEALEDTVLVCVFNPPLKGREVHGKDGSYGL